jgi:hypothetical protein
MTPTAESLFVYWPVGIALACWLFIEIARRV